MSHSVVRLVFILCISTYIQAKSVDTCNDACLVKSYGLTRDGIVGCSGDNCLMEASFEASLINNRVVVNFNVIGHKFSSLKDQTYVLTLSNGAALNQYSCFINSYGLSDALVTNDVTSYKNGSSQIKSENLYCSWYMTFDSDIWPTFGYGKETFQDDSSLKIFFKVAGKTFSIASSVKDLPIYRMQFLKCCYRVYGNEIYKLIPDQNEQQTNFLMQKFNNKNDPLTAILSDHNGKKLVFDCDYYNKRITVFLKTEALSDDISAQIKSFSFMDGFQCSWSLPLIVKGSFSNYDTTNGVYNLAFVYRSQVVYNQTNVSLRGFSTKIISSLLLIIFTLSMNFVLY